MNCKGLFARAAGQPFFMLNHLVEYAHKAAKLGFGDCGRISGGIGWQVKYSKNNGLVGIPRRGGRA